MGHLAEDAIFDAAVHGFLVSPSPDVGAEVDDTLNYTFGEDVLVAFSAFVVDNRHSLDRAIKWVLGDLGPSVICFKRLPASGETVSKDLKGDLSRIANCYPLVLLIVTHSGKITQRSRSQKGLELLRECWNVCDSISAFGLLVLFARFLRGSLFISMAL